MFSLIQYKINVSRLIIWLFIASAVHILIKIHCKYNKIMLTFTTEIKD